jgi:hypothetical protein
LRYLVRLLEALLAPLSRRPDVRKILREADAVRRAEEPSAPCRRS